MFGVIFYGWRLGLLDGGCCCCFEVLQHGVLLMFGGLLCFVAYIIDHMILFLSFQRSLRCGLFQLKR